MIQITFQFTDIASAAALLAKLNGNEIGAMRSPGVSAHEKVVLLASAEAQMADTVDPKPATKPEAPGKPSAAPTAPSQPTAEAAPSQPGPSADAPESKTTATEPTAAASSAPADDKPFDYATLQKAVNERVAKFGKDALLAIAQKHGAGTFKALDASKWAAAHADVVALG